MASDKDNAPNIFSNEGPKKRSITLWGHRTSITLEDAFWHSLKEVAAAQNLSLPNLVQEIDEKRGEIGLSSSIRLYVLNYYKARAKGQSLDTFVPDQH